jgi:hypothetical protein
MAMVTQEKFEQIISRLDHAYQMAQCPAFKAVWLAKAREIQRRELAEMKLNQQEGHIQWQ